MSKIVKNLLAQGNPQNFGGVMVDGQDSYTILDNELKAFQASTVLISALTLQTPTASISDSTTPGVDLDGSEGVNFLLDIGKLQKVENQSSPPFASKYLADGRSLNKRVHGENGTILANDVGEVNHIVTYTQCKFAGAEIFGCQLKDTVNFKILDTDQNTYSGLDVGIHGANVVLNQFGFDAEMKDGGYANTSNYDANVYVGMIICCEYTNNDTVDKYVGVNFELHEVIT